jgi:hypothetical protein
MSRTAPDFGLTKIDLMRGGNIVSTLTGAFGQSLRETRLTAMLGYLIALNPEPFLYLFGFHGVPQRVCLETHHDQGRSDILVETNMGTGVIEAKVDATDPMVQSRRYPARWVALLTHRLSKTTNNRTRYVTWKQLAELLQRMGRSRSTPFHVFARDLLGYMQVHHMTRERNSVELYAREINEPVTLALFLKAQLYGCPYQAGSRLAEALYFAPHFGKRITNEHPGVSVGISYVARIESVGNVTTWQDFREFMLEERDGLWWKRHKTVLQELRQNWSWNQGQQRSILLLGTPRLAFNPPVRKENLQLGKGWLSKRFYSFDDLFSAWGK